MWIELLLCQIYRLCLSHNYISTSAVFIGLTSLSTYGFGHQRLSKKGGIKVLGFKADCGAVELNGLGAHLSHALKESFLPVSPDVFVTVMRARPPNHEMVKRVGQSFPFVVFINWSAPLGHASIRSPPANLLLSCSSFVVFNNQQKIWTFQITKCVYKLEQAFISLCCRWKVATTTVLYSIRTIHHQVNHCRSD